jgi:hypothetical protein
MTISDSEPTPVQITITSYRMIKQWLNTDPELQYALIVCADVSYEDILQLLIRFPSEDQVDDSQFASTIQNYCERGILTVVKPHQFNQPMTDDCQVKCTMVKPGLIVQKNHIKFPVV